MDNIYHTTLNEDKDAVLQTGLKATTKPLLDSLESVQADGYYFFPEDWRSARSFAQQLLRTVLESERPAKYPPHHECLFFFPTQALVGELDRDAVLQIDTDAFNSHYPIYQAPFDTATELLFNKMETFEFSNEFSVDEIHSLATQYWNETTTIQSKQDITSGTEVFAHIQRIPPEYITLI